MPTSLDRLMRACATLAEDGQDADLAWYDGQARAAPRALMAPDAARQIGLLLSDPMARLQTFAFSRRSS